MSMVAKEKEKILEMMFDYARALHKHLEKIDRNSTITVQGRSLKMLRLNLLNWEEEVIGAALTTRNLYDSGGEGFLSAFVVLYSLLNYMRRDDTDLFVEREEGKVLVMDNPFAQTNTSYLLKPLILMKFGLTKDLNYVKAEHVKGSEKEVMQTVRAARIEVEDGELMELVF